MEDLCLRGVSEDGSVKLWLAQTTNLCEEGRRRHDAWSVGAAALGRLLTAGVFFGLNLKGEGDSVTLRVNGDGPLGSLAVVAEPDGAVRGFVANPQVDIDRRPDGKLDVGTAVGNGTLTVIKDMGFGQPYTGTVNLATTWLSIIWNQSKRRLPWGWVCALRQLARWKRRADFCCRFCRTLTSR